MGITRIKEDIIGRNDTRERVRKGKKNCGKKERERREPEIRRKETLNERKE